MISCTVTVVRKHRAWPAIVASVIGIVWSPLAGQFELRENLNQMPSGGTCQPQSHSVSLPSLVWISGEKDWVGWSGAPAAAYKGHASRSAFLCCTWRAILPCGTKLLGGVEAVQRACGHTWRPLDG